jgi:4-hydroxybenzoate polyprenyltransferase
VVRAIKTPSPELVQAAVKACIFGLVGLEAIHASMVIGLPGLLLLLFLPPALLLGRWVYST